LKRPRAELTAEVDRVQLCTAPRVCARTCRARSAQLDKDLGLLSASDVEALVEAGTLELLLRYLTVDQHFDVVTKCLITLSTFDSARTGLYEMREVRLGPRRAHVSLLTA
jgi:hypothetical protein